MAFIKRFTANEKGAIVITGNSMGLSRQQNTASPGTNHSINQLVSTSTTITPPSAWVSIASIPNSENITPDWRLDSSSANLNMLSGYTVLYAELIWGGLSKNNGGGVTSDVSASLNDPVYFVNPSGTSFSINPSTVTASTVAYSSNQTFYIRSQDVTTIVQNGGIGKYTVGRVPSALNINETTPTANAGWTLLVAYKNPNLSPKNMNIYVGENLISGNPVDIPISGFLTPASGPIQGRLSVSAQEGDAVIDGDNLYFGPNAQSLTIISGPNNPVNNFFSSQINIGDPNNANVGTIDTSGTYGNRNANALNGTNIIGGRQVWDITNVSVSNALVNNQSSALFRITTGGDVYAVNAVGLTIETILISGVKSVNTTIANLGDTLTYTVQLTNEGGLTQNNIGFRDTIPNGTTFVDGSLIVSAPYTGTNIQNGITISSMSAGQIVTLQWQVKVGNTIPNPNPILNVGQILFPGLSVSNTNTVSTRINTADISVLKTTPNTIAIPGDTIAYSVVVSNSGPNDASNVNLLDIRPNEIRRSTYSTDGGVTWNPYTPNISIGTLSAGTSTTILIQDLIFESSVGTIVNVATVSSSTPDPNLNNNSSTTTTPIFPEADISVDKYFSPNTVIAVQNLSYTLSIKNLGPSFATSVVLIDTISNSLENVVFSNDGGLTYESWSGSFFVGTIPNNYSHDILLRERVKSSTTNSILNTVSITSPIFDPNTINNISTVTTPISIVADVFVVKLQDPTIAIQGETLTYSNFIKNVGPSDATTIVLYDDVPSSISSVQLSTDGGATYNPWVSPYTVGNLAVNEGTTILIRGIINTQDRTTNFATIVASSYDPNEANNSSFISTDPNQIVSLTISKNASPNTVVAGEILSYTVAVCNSGPLSALDVTIFDTVASTRLINPLNSPVNGTNYIPFTGEFNFGVLPNDSCQNLYIKGQISSTDGGGSISNTVIVKSTGDRPQEVVDVTPYINNPVLLTTPLGNTIEGTSNNSYSRFCSDK